ncbi:hypothetical protein [Actinomycetospora aeridis]|uniref:Uncharacterized protein n=1 Tax=Actinomycetospora aeridis TaxID=3129231 RepID=A0ABU8N1C8_9PSEU
MASNLSRRPPYRHRDDRDPRLYDLSPRPTCRLAPYGWTKAGQLAHRQRTLRALSALAFVAGMTYGRAEAEADAESQARERDLRRGLAERMAALHSELLADPRTAAAPTDAFPRQEAG